MASISSGLLRLKSRNDEVGHEKTHRFAMGFLKTINLSLFLELLSIRKAPLGSGAFL